VDAEVPPTGGAESFRTLDFPAVYLNPGELTLMAYADRGEVALNTVGFVKSAQQPALLSAALATRGGVAELAGVGEAGHANGYVRNLGRKGSTITFGVDGGTGGARILRLQYASGQSRDVALSLAVGANAPVKVAAPPTNGEWRTLDLPVTVAPGTNRMIL